MSSARPMRAGVLAWLLALGICVAMGAVAAPTEPAAAAPAGARFAVHDRFDRLVIPLPAAGEFSAQAAGGVLRLAIPALALPAGVIDGASGDRLLRAEAAPGALLVTYAAGTRPKVFPIGQRLVIDIVNGDGPPQVTGATPARAGSSPAAGNGAAINAGASGAAPAGAATGGVGRDAVAPGHSGLRPAAAGAATPGSGKGGGDVTVAPPDPPAAQILALPAGHGVRHLAARKLSQPVAASQQVISLAPVQPVLADALRSPGANEAAAAAADGPAANAGMGPGAPDAAPAPAGTGMAGPGAVSGSAGPAGAGPAGGPAQAAAGTGAGGAAQPPGASGAQGAAQVQSDARPQSTTDAQDAVAAHGQGAPPVSAPIDVGGPAAGLGNAVAVTLQPEASPLGPSIFLPFPRDEAAAAFRRGADGVAVFDGQKPLDLGQLKADPVFGAATARVLPGGIALRVPLPDGVALHLAHLTGGWLLTLARPAPALARIAATAEKNVLRFQAAAPGHVLVLDDPPTGGKLLVGPQRAAGQAFGTTHQAAEFAVLPTFQGVVVEPRIDRLSLIPVKDGFHLQAASGPPLAFVWSDAAGTVLTRRFDFPDAPRTVLENRLTLAVRDSALTPKLSRFPARKRVAAAMLSLGFDDEARAVLHAATADDPASAADSDAVALDQIAAFLVARAGGAMPPPEAVNEAPFGDSDEGRFWRALLSGGKPSVDAEAATLAATWPLLRLYPEDLRRRLLAPVAEILARGGQTKALDALLQASDDPSLDLQRALRLQRQGKTSAALAWLDSIARRPDRLLRAGAMRQAVELRLGAKTLTVKQAAAALEKQLYAWRGGPSDLALRLRVANLDAQAGAWRQALALLRETDAAFPEAHAQIAEAENRLVGDLLKGGAAASLGALDLVALAQEAGPVLTAADADATLAPILVDKLLALDLPARAEPILRKLLDQAKTGQQKAQLGTRLASLLAENGDVKGALDLLGKEDEPALPESLRALRNLLRAKLLARSGRQDDALHLLAGRTEPESAAFAAQILEGRNAWPEAAKLLRAMTDSDAFAALPEDAQRNAILRLANDESEAHDMAGLRALREKEAKRFAKGPGAELFAVLTEDPIEGTGDLPRSQREMEAVRALPASLGSDQKNFR